jgi:hypothetical protein
MSKTMRGTRKKDPSYSTTWQAGLVVRDFFKLCVEQIFLYFLYPCVSGAFMFCIQVIVITSSHI